MSSRNPRHQPKTFSSKLRGILPFVSNSERAFGVIKRTESYPCARAAFFIFASICHRSSIETSSRLPLAEERTFFHGLVHHQQVAEHSKPFVAHLGVFPKTLLPLELYIRA